MSETTVNLMDEAAADEIAISFAEAGAAADLSDWMHRYPAYSGDFARIAAERWAGAPYGAETSDLQTESEASILRFKAIAGEIANARRAVIAAAPLTSLLSAARERGLDAQSLASQLRLPYALFFKLHRRLIAPDSLPRLLVEQLASSLGRTADEISAYFRMPPTLAAGASYRADSAPRAGQQESFADALARDPDSTAEQRSYYSIPVPDRK